MLPFGLAGQPGTGPAGEGISLEPAEMAHRRLGLARLGTVYIHDCDAGVHGAAYPHVLRQVVNEALPALRRAYVTKRRVP